MIEKLIEKKGYHSNITFKELFDRTNIKLTITGTCLNTRKIVYFSVDKTPDMKLKEAIRISISVPLYFTPYNYNNYLYVDGGCIDNYPISLFDNDLESVIGIYLSDDKETIHNINTIDDYIKSICHSLLEGVASNSIRGYKDYSIRIDVKNIDFMNMDITNEKKKELYDYGFNIVNNIFFHK